MRVPWVLALVLVAAVPLHPVFAQEPPAAPAEPGLVIVGHGPEPPNVGDDSVQPAVDADVPAVFVPVPFVAAPIVNGAPQGNGAPHHHRRSSSSISGRSRATGGQFLGNPSHQFLADPSRQFLNAIAPPHTPNS